MVSTFLDCFCRNTMPVRRGVTGAVYSRPTRYGRPHRVDRLGMSEQVGFG